MKKFKFDPEITELCFYFFTFMGGFLNIGLYKLNKLELDI